MDQTAGLPDPRSATGPLGAVLQICLKTKDFWPGSRIYRVGWQPDKGLGGATLSTKIDRRPAGVTTPVANDPITIGPNRAIHVDLSKVAIPSHVYDADFAWVEHRRGAVALLFGKLDRDEPGRLRTRLQLRYPPESFVGHFWKNSRDFQGRLQDYVSKWKDVAGDVAQAPEKMKALKDHSEWVNFEALAHAGSEACMDFYQLSPAGIAKFARGQGSSALRVTPIVRVQLTVFALAELFRAAEPIVAEIERYLPQPETEKGGN